MPCQYRFNGFDLTKAMSIGAYNNSKSIYLRYYLVSN